MDHQFYEYLEEKFRDVKEDIKGDISDLNDKFDKHIEEDKKAWAEVFFVKRFIYTSWALFLAWIGYTKSH
jgi:hypothetical protein